ncbi:hypothetical protein ACFQ1S_12310 [Kibdelosporangium lantanae]|uniref:Uncharacterized protein n=1 Tax=Kibdelosporangium lantanae TaxID=1497396 RepID=A0ABW3M6F1_9PSEU
MTHTTATRRRAFVDQISLACAEVGATITWHSDDWVSANGMDLESYYRVLADFFDTGVMREPRLRSSPPPR